MYPAKDYLKKIERFGNPKEDRLKYLRLDKNENIVTIDNKFIGLLRKEITSDFLTAYPQIYPLYEKIAHWLGCKEDQVYITSGSDAAIKAVFETTIEPGDSVLLLNPTYAMFNVYVKLFRAKLLEVNYKSGLSLSVDEIVKKIKARKPKLVCIANPDSPTGTVLKPQDLEKIIECTDEYGGAFLLDEAYYLFYSKTAMALIPKYQNLVITRTFSKAMGLASARLGYIISNKSVIGHLKKARPMYETNAFAAKFGELVLDNYQIVKNSVGKIMTGKNYLEDGLNKLNFKYYNSYTNFILIDMGSAEKSKRIGESLKKKGILVKYGLGGVIGHCIRVTIGERWQMETFLTVLKGVISL